MPPDDSHPVCNVCGWCNDPVYESGVNTAARLGPNSVSLDDARVNFERHGSIYPLVDLDRVAAASVRTRVSTSWTRPISAPRTSPSASSLAQQRRSTTGGHLLPRIELGLS